MVRGGGSGLWVTAFWGCRGSLVCYLFPCMCISLCDVLLCLSTSCAPAMVLVATRPGSLDLSPARSGWDVGGLVRFVLFVLASSRASCVALWFLSWLCMSNLSVCCRVRTCVVSVCCPIVRLLLHFCFLDVLCMLRAGYCARQLLWPRVRRARAAASALYPEQHSSWRWRSSHAWPAGPERTRSLPLRALTLAAELRWGGVLWHPPEFGATCVQAPAC